MWSFHCRCWSISTLSNLLLVAGFNFLPDISNSNGQLSREVYSFQVRCRKQQLVSSFFRFNAKFNVDEQLPRLHRVDVGLGIWSLMDEYTKIVVSSAKICDVYVKDQWTQYRPCRHLRLERLMPCHQIVRTVCQIGSLPFSEWSYNLC